MLSRILLVTLMMSMNAFAADDCSPTVIDPNVLKDLSGVASKMKTECPHQLNVSDFCAAVASQAPEISPINDSVIYRYQNQIFAAACVVSGDSDETIKAKVQNYWNNFHDRLACNQFNFTPQNGNILKLAIARKSDPFIDDVVTTWKVNLNHVDGVDQKTVLDYIEAKKIEAGSNASLVRIFQKYYDKFRNAGAKHSREL
jgi:protein tyrosine phosphatase